MSSATTPQLPPLYTIHEVIDIYLEEIRPKLDENEYSTRQSILLFFRGSLDRRGTSRLEGDEKRYMQSFRGPDNFYCRTFSQLFGPSKIEEGLYSYMRRFYATGRVIIDRETFLQVPRVMRSFCDWLATEGYVRAPIVEPFERYERALKRDAAERRRGKVPLSDRQPANPFCLGCHELEQMARAWSNVGPSAAVH